MVHFQSSSVFTSRNRPSQLEKGKQCALRHLDELTLVRPHSTPWGFVFVDLSFAERSDHREISGRYDLHENIGKKKVQVGRIGCADRKGFRGGIIFSGEAGSVS